MTTIEAVRELRKQTGDSQQAFATRLGLSIRAIANYETDRGPTGKALAALEHLASVQKRYDLAEVFHAAMVEHLGLSAGPGKPGWKRMFAAPDGYDDAVMIAFQDLLETPRRAEVREKVLKLMEPDIRNARRKQQQRERPPAKTREDAWQQTVADARDLHKEMQLREKESRGKK